MSTPVTDDQFRSAARSGLTDEDSVFTNATVSRGREAGAYVECWVWVADPSGVPSEDGVAEVVE